MHVASFMKVGGGRLIKKFSTKERKKKKKEKSSPNRKNPNLFLWGGGGIAYYTLNFNLLLISLFISFHSLRFYMLQKRRGVQLQVIYLFLCKVKKNICCKKKCPLSSTPPMLRACSSCS